MDIFIIALVLLTLVGMKPVSHNPDYLSRNTTTCIKGFFAVIIVFAHAAQYIDGGVTYWGGDSYNLLYKGTIELFGQLIVVMFLTYSGYGIMESFKNKGSSYLEGFFRKRTLKTLLHFDLAVAMFLILTLALEIEYDTKNYLLCWIGWESIGNSNWFIFDIIILYLITQVCLLVFCKLNLSRGKFLLLISGLSVMFLISMMILKKGELWWYDTILSFPAGMVWSAYKTEIEKFTQKQINYIFLLAILTIAFLGSMYLGRHIKAVFLFPGSALFGLWVIVLTMRMRVGNRVLYWLGINSFSIYILQRLPMIAASEYGLNDRPVLFVAIVLALSFLIGSIFTKVTDKIDARLFAPSPFRKRSYL